MPGKLMDKFTVFDMNQSYMFAGFAIFGLLKGQIPPEEGERLLKKIATAAQIAGCSNVKECEGLLGSKYHDLMVDVVNVEDVTQIVNANEKDTRGYQPNFYVKFTDDRWEGPIQDSVDGLKELSALMEEKLPNIKFPTESSKNYAYAIKDFIDKVAYGDGVTKAIDENAGYQYMFNLFAKLDMTGATFTDQNKVTLNEDGSRNIQKMDGLWLNVREKDDMRIMAAYDNSGILDAMAGGVRITNKTKDHLTTGDVSRDELLDEYRLQYQRMQKALSLSKEEYDKIAAAGGVANDYEEFTWGPRGYGKILKDVENRIRFMDAGFPVSDLADLCVMDEYVNSLERIYQDRVSSYEYENRSIAEAREKINKSEPKNDIEKAEKEKKLKDLDAREEKQKARKEENDINAQSIDQLKKDWNKVFEGKGLTQEERIGKLENFSASIKAAKNNIKNMGDKNLEVLSTRLEARKNAVLSEGEKSLMASTPEEMLANLNSVDPKLMVSSKEFRKMKTELANLNRAKQAIEKAETLIDKKDAEAEYRKQAEKTYKATRNYLRYKTRQMNGPKRGHKRSEIEKKRVQVADGILNSLRNLKFDNNNPVLSDTKKATVVPNPGSTIMGEVDKDKLPVSYDSYITLHTGKGSMNGSKEEMIQDVSKILAAHVIMSQKPVPDFDPKRIEKLASKMADIYQLNDLKNNELQKILQNPKEVKKFGMEERNRLYGYRDMQPDEYEKYVKDMRLLYCNLPTPGKESPELQKILNGISVIAHLPTTMEGSDPQKVNDVIAKANMAIMEGVEAYMKKHASDTRNRLYDIRATLHVVTDANDNITYRFTEGLEKVNQARGANFINSPDHLTFDDIRDFNMDNIDLINPERELDANKLVQSKKAVEVKRAKEAPELRGNKKLESVNIPGKKAKEAMNPTSRPKLEPVAAGGMKL